MDNNHPKLSIALAVYNEESTLGECLESIKAIADEIVIVMGHQLTKQLRLQLNSELALFMNKIAKTFTLINKSRSMPVPETGFSS